MLIAKRLIQQNKFKVNNEILRKAKLNKSQQLSLRRFQQKTKSLNIKQSKLESQRRRLVVQEKQLVKGKLKQKQLLQVRQKQKLILKQKSKFNKQLSKLASRSFNLFAGGLVASQRFRTKQGFRQPQAPALKQPQAQGFRQPQAQRFRQPQAPRLRITPRFSRTPKKPLPFLRVKIKGKPTVRKTKRGFNVFAKPVKGKKLIKINKVPCFAFGLKCGTAEDFEYALDRGLYLIESKAKELQGNLDKKNEIQINSISSDIPDWLKINAKWYSMGMISGKEFAHSIQFLIKEELIQMDKTGGTNKSSLGQDATPEWVQKSTGWWADGLVSNAEFISGLSHLVNIGVI